MDNVVHDVSKVTLHKKCYLTRDLPVIKEFTDGRPMVLGGSISVYQLLDK